MREASERERWRRVEAIFLSVCDLETERRAEMLTLACGDDQALREEVESLLADGEDDCSLLDTPIAPRGLFMLDEEPARPLTSGRSPRHGDGGDISEAPQSSDASEESAAELLARLERRGARYEKQGQIDHGGQGAILRVWDEELRRHLAMKVMLSGRRATAGGDLRSLKRFLGEAQVTGQLDHPGIVPVHELGLDEQGRVYFTMKLVEGESLAAIFAKLRGGHESWTRTRALGVLLKVCEAVSFAHAKGVIHRDLKPANVMVGRFGEVYVMDWGLARVRQCEDGHDLRIRSPDRDAPRSGSENGTDRRDSPLVTMDGDVLGTPSYMAPEQALGQVAEMGPQSDVYSAGAMLYELLSGRAPYVDADQRPSGSAVWMCVRKGPPAPLGTGAVDAPAELTAICERAMERDPRRRYGDMSDLAADLQAFLEHRVVSAYETGAVAELRKWVQRNRGLAYAMVAGVLVLFSGLTAGWILKVRSDEHATLASERGDALLNANEGLEHLNQELERRRDEAEKLADEARTQATVARREHSRVLRLSAYQELDDLLVEADSMNMWPAWPDRIERYEAWLERARHLIAGLEPSASGGDPGHRRQLKELEAQARPETHMEREDSRRAHPRYAELLRLEKRLASVRRAQAVRQGTLAPQAVALDASTLPEDSVALASQAWVLVGPERSKFGEEARGLALARLALEVVEDEEQLLEAQRTLAWALFANGMDEEALAEGATALSLAPESAHARVYREHSELRKAVESVASLREPEALEAQRNALETEISQDRGRRFADDSDRWWHDQLVVLIAAIEAFADPSIGLVSTDAVSPEHGWSVGKRLAIAHRLRGAHAENGAHSRAWAAALPTINAAYPGLRLRPQTGLVPLGPDPASGLWEFADVQTGRVPERDEDGNLIVTEEAGLVFVLLPGGRFSMGAQKKDPDGLNFDPRAPAQIGPVHEVTLSPFFLSKYEMTQGQWQRFNGENPSEYRPQTYDPRWNAAALPGDLTHPVEGVDWYECMKTCERLGLQLPSEAQWEYAARAGTSSVWWTGDEEESVAGAANMSDHYARDHGGSDWEGLADWLDDGNLAHAGVGGFAPNPFGLHDVMGNLWEWCQDAYDEDFYDKSPDIDPVAESAPRDGRVRRGGGFAAPPSRGRSAYRASARPDYHSNFIGLRPARSIDP